MIGGYSLSCIGDERNHSCVLSKNSNTQSDKSLIEAYKKLKIKYKIYPFLERGSDERQYNSPGIDLPIALICRSKFQKFPEYHTSLDNFKLVTLKGVSGGFNVAKTAIEILQKKIIPINNILCEPQMSKRLLYPSISLKNKKKLNQNFMHFLQYSDGKNDIKDISKILKLNHKSVQFIYNTLKKKNANIIIMKNVNRHIEELKKNGLTIIENVLNESECNLFVKSSNKIVSKLLNQKKNKNI